MKTFHDLDTEKRFEVVGERQTVDEDSKIHLDHTPLTGTLVIDGYRRNLSGLNLASDEFYIDYHERSGYKLATQAVTIGPGNIGVTVTASYTGVGTIIFARDMNEIKSFMDEGAAKIMDDKIAGHSEDKTVHQDIRDAVEDARKEIGDNIDVHNRNTLAHEDIRNAVKGVSDELEHYQRGIQTTIKNAIGNAVGNGINAHNYEENAHPIILRRIQTEVDRLEALIGTTLVYRGDVETFQDLPMAEPEPDPDPAGSTQGSGTGTTEPTESTEPTEEPATEPDVESEAAETDAQDYDDAPEEKHYATVGDVYRVITAAPEYGVRALDFVLWAGASWLPLTSGVWDAIEAMGKRLDELVRQVSGCCEIESWFLGTGGSGIDYIPHEDEVEPITDEEVDEWFTPPSTAPRIRADDFVTADDVDEWFVGTKEAEMRERAEIDEIVDSPLPDGWTPDEYELGPGDIDDVYADPTSDPDWEPSEDELTKPEIHEAVEEGNED